MSETYLLNQKINEEKYYERLRHALRYKEVGRVTQNLGMVYEAYLPGVSVGSLCRILTSNDSDSSVGIDAEVIGFKNKHVILMPLDDLPGVSQGSRVVLCQSASSICVGKALLGRVIDAKGDPIDGKGPIELGSRGPDNLEQRVLYSAPAHPLERELIREPLDLGVRSINGLLSCGKGQRFGIVAGSGVGKSVLLGMMARNAAADVNVIALIGERGREVREFVERDLGTEGLKRSVIIVTTSDKSPLLRVRGAFLATTIAEYFRDQGKDVLLLMDSLTRFCMAQREIGLSVGEPPVTKGYTPSVFSKLPKLLERAGMAPKKGSVTGVYTVLVENEDGSDPIMEIARSILDGHIFLSRKLAQRNYFPAVDVLQSSSRVMRSVVSSDHLSFASQIREWLALYSEVEHLIQIGAYVSGVNRRIDQAVAVIDHIEQFLRQDVNDVSDFSSTLEWMRTLISNYTLGLTNLNNGKI